MNKVEVPRYPLVWCFIGIVLLLSIAMWWQTPELFVHMTHAFCV